MPATPARSQLLTDLREEVLADLRGLVVVALAVGAATATLPLLAWSVVSPLLRGLGRSGDQVPGVVQDLTVVTALVGVLVGSWVLTCRQEAAARSRRSDGFSPGRPR